MKKIIILGLLLLATAKSNAEFKGTTNPYWHASDTTSRTTGPAYQSLNSFQQEMLKAARDVAIVTPIQKEPTALDSIPINQQQENTTQTPFKDLLP